VLEFREKNGDSDFRNKLGHLLQLCVCRLVHGNVFFSEPITVTPALGLVCLPRNL